MAEEESFISHLVELRDRLIKSLIVVLVLFGVCFYFSGDIMKFLSQPLYQALPAGSKPIFTDQAGAFFLCVGIGFAYLFVLPAAYKFFISFAAQTGAETMQDLQKYWDFTLSIFFGFGLTFEVPVVEMLLVKMGMVTTKQLREARRYVVVGAFVVAAVLTPPDVLSQFMLAVPLVLLYELGIFMAGFVTARSRNPEKAADEAAEAAAESQAPGSGS